MLILKCPKCDFTIAAHVGELVGRDPTGKL